MMPVLGLCFLSGVSRPRRSNPRVMEELCWKRMGALLKEVVADFWRGCPRTEPALFQGGLFFLGKLGEVPHLKGWVTVSPVSNPSLSPPCAPMGGWARKDRLLLPLARLTLKSMGSLWTCT